jgi:3-isopropylmalate/(R)-2-methylmalate dehydratase small subunit
MGVRAVIAVSFSDIFSGNAFKNGILTIELPQEQIDMLLETTKTGELAIDLPSQTITTEGGASSNFRWTRSESIV